MRIDTAAVGATGWNGSGWDGMGPSTVERDGAIVNIASFGKVVARAFNR